MLRFKRTFGVISLVVLGLAVLTSFLVNTPMTRADSRVIYVDTNAPGPARDGSSWATAYVNLQAALDIATYGDEIWVADGIYTPTNTTNRSATFALKSGVALYGGFGGYGISETQRTQRNWTIYESILSGDLDGNDLNTDTNFIAETVNDIIGSNAYHVVSSTNVTATARIDGFIITAGWANIYPDEGGGGLYNDDGSPTLANLVFSGNLAVEQGGGMYNINGAPTLINVTFSGNMAIEGGGMINEEGAPVLTDVIFHLNRALIVGGGMANNYSSPTLTDVIFRDNLALSRNGGGASGGGMSNYSSNLTLTNVTFSNNWATDNGGGMVTEYGYLTLNNVTFSGNQAIYGYGGGMMHYHGVLTLTNVTFSGNQAVNASGGGMLNTTNIPKLMNVTFINNLADKGGGVANFQSNPTLVNVTFSGNQATHGGGGMDNDVSYPTLANCILWGDSAPEINNNASSGVSVIYSDVQGGYTGTHNLDIDPLFANPALGDYRLRSGSPAIDAGNNFSVTLSVDRDDNIRRVDVPSIPDKGNGAPPIVDMGAYEFQTQVYGLVVGLAGNGNGQVTSLPLGIDCGSTCSAVFDYDTAITLTATPWAATPSTVTVFAGWSGDIITSTNPLALTTYISKQITATFNTFTVTSKIYLAPLIRSAP